MYLISVSYVYTLFLLFALCILVCVYFPAILFCCLRSSSFVANNVQCIYLSLSISLSLYVFVSLFVSVSLCLLSLSFSLSQLCSGGSVTDLVKHLLTLEQTLDEQLIAHILRETMLVRRRSLHCINLLNEPIIAHILRETMLVRRRSLLIK